MAAVRVSAGFRPNKMLLSMREGGVCLCVCADREEEAEQEGCPKA